MHDQRTITTWIRLVLAAVLATTLGIAVGTFDSGVVSAANIVPTTKFVIDGNRAGPDDFAEPYGPGTTPGGFPTTGIYYNNRTVDQGGASGCNLANDDTAGPGIAVGDGPVWPIGGPNPNGKTDLDFVDVAAEKVSRDGQIDDILYIGYQKCGGNGTWQAALHLDDGDGLAPTQGDLNGDYLFIFDFNPSSGAVSFFLYRREAGAWAGPKPIPAGQVHGAAAVDYGEVALNLTGLKIIGNGGSVCQSVGIGSQVAAITGGDLSSKLKDLLNVAPLVISNCGAIDIEKISSPAGIDTDDLFHYSLSQADADGDPATVAGTVHDASVTVTAAPVQATPFTTEPDANNEELDADIAIETTHSWRNVVSQPDYLLRETLPDPASGWRLGTIACTYTDIFVAPPAPKTVVLYDRALGGDQNARFLIPPSSFANQVLPPASCEITNETSGLTVVKTGSGDATQDFPFTVTGKAPFDLRIADDATTAGIDESRRSFAVTPGIAVDVTETVPTTAPGWTLSGVACTLDADGSQVPFEQSGTSVTVAPIAGQGVTCTFTNVQAGRIDVVKAGAGTTAGPFDFATSYGDGFQLSIGDPAAGSGDLAAGDYTVSELLDAFNASIAPAPAFVGSVECTSATGSSTSSESGVDASISLAAGDTVTCTFTNVQNGRIIVRKTVVDGDGTFSFTGAVSGNITTTGGATPVGAELSADVAPGTYAVAETPTPGYTLTSSSCDDGSTVGSISVAAGEIVTCTFTNTRNAGSFTLQKSWGDADAGETVDLTAGTAGSGPLDAPISTSATAPAGATGDNTMTVYSGQTIEFGESFAVGANASNYSTTLGCLGATVVADPDNRGGSIQVGDDPGAITCTFTNTRKQAGVRLQKVWVDSLAGDTADLTVSATGATPDTARSIAPAAPTYGGPADSTDSTAFIVAFAGQTVTLGEALSSPANYVTSLACTGAGNEVDVAPDGRSGTLAITAADDGAEIICTITNARIAVDLTVAKSWVDAAGGDTVSITTTGADDDVDFDAAAGVAGDAAVTELDTDPIGYTVYAGETLTFSEDFGVGDPDAYTTTFSCDGTDPATDQVLTVDPTDGPLTCTYVNVRRTLDVRVAKDLAPETDGGRFDLSIDGALVVDAAGDGDTSTPVTVFVGDTVTLAETADAAGPALANYTSTLACDNGVVLDVDDGTAGSFAAPSSLADDAVVTCTFTNTRKQANLVVTKNWADSPANDDAVALVIAGGLVAATAGSNVNDDPDAGDDDATSVVYAGELITVSEQFTSGSAANYDSSLVCSDASGTLFATNGLTRDFTIPATATDITCEFTNTRIRSELTLRKRWMNAAAGDTAELTVAGQDPASPASATSTATDGHSLDTTNVAVLTVWAGETVDLDEVVAPGADYTSSLSCTGSDRAPSGADRSHQLDITPADRGEAIVCTFLNRRVEITVQLTKNWSTSPINGDAVDLTIGGSLLPAVTGSSSHDAIANDSVATVQALAGETVTLTEAFARGLPENYLSSLACLDAQGASVGDALTYSAGALIGDLAIDSSDAGTTIRCTFSNVRKSTGLVLAKNWIAGVGGDAVDLAIQSTDSDGVTVVAPAGGFGASADVASITVYAGDSVLLTETIDPTGSNVARYDVTAFSCTGGDQTPAWVAGDTAATLAVSAADIDVANLADMPITCTFTNTARRGTIVVVKSVDGTGDGTFGFAGDWPAVDATDPADFGVTTIGQTGSVAFVGVPVPKDGAPYTIVETDPTATFDGTDVTCVDGDGGSGPDGSSQLPLTGSIELDHGETVTCTFTNTERSTIVVVKDAQPDAAQDFDFTTIEPAGGDFLDDGFILDDDADGTHSNTYTSVLVPGGATYSVTELPTFGWTLDPSSSCSVGGDFDGTTASITPAPGTTVTCTFVNTANPAGLSATKSVSGQVGPWGPFVFTLSGGAFNGDAAQPVDSTAPTADWTDLVEGQEYTLTETAVAGYAPGAAFVCQVGAPGAEDPVDLVDADPIADGFQFTAIAGAIYDCDITNVALPGSVDVTKTATGVAADVAWAFDLTIAPVPASDPAQDPTHTATGLGNETSAAVSWTGLAPGTTYLITEAVPAGWSQGPIECTVTPADLQVSPVVTTDGSFTVTPGASVTCDFDNAADTTVIEITKTVDGGLDEATSWAFDFTIAPIPADESSPKTATGTGDSSDTVGWAGLVAGETYTIGEVVPDGNTTGFVPGDLTCAGIDDLDQVPQTFTFVAPLGLGGVDVACSITNTAQSDVEFDKTFRTEPVRNSDGSWTLVYEIVVANAADAGSATYDLSDSFAFGDGVDILADSADVDSDPAGAIATNGAFDGVADPVVVTGQPIAAGETHTYVVTVDVTIEVGPATDGDCVRDDEGGTGFLNQMTIAIDGGQPEIDPACAGFSMLTLVKKVVNDHGGNAVIADFPLTAVGSQVTLTGISGTAAVSSAVPAGSYLLSEESLPGYSTEGFVCEGGGGFGDDEVTLAIGDRAVCTIVNDDPFVIVDQRFDLQLTKGDGGVTALAGGDPWTYTISVRNVGTRDADLGEPVTVVDELPTPLAWVAFPSNCLRDGQTLTCDIDPALLRVGGAAVVISATVRAPASAPSGIYVNHAFVTTADDPVCVPVGCEPPPCEGAAGNNNVDCEETPVDRVGAIQIVKTDDVPGAQTVEPGDTYAYRLVVANTGLSSILPGLVVDDDLPAELQLVSVKGGSGWTCGNVDPIECTYGRSLAPGATASTITVTVAVADDATAENIVNVAVVTGAIDRDCPTVAERLTQSFVPACSQVTDDDDEVTPLAVNADLAIVKSASQPIVGAGGVFDWVLDVTNNGPGTGVNVVVGDLVPSPLTVTGVTSSFFDCDHVGNAVTCTRPAIAVGASGTVTIAVAVPVTAETGVIVNVGTVESATPDPDLSNNSDEASVDMVAAEPPSATPPPARLPRTGSDATGDLVRAAFLLVLVGAAIVLASRRRRGAEETTAI